MHRLLLLVVSCALLLRPAPTAAQNAAAPQQVTRTVYVSVTDRAGSPPALAPSDFNVREGGQVREVTAVAPASGRMHLTLLVEETLTSAGGVRAGLAQFVQRMLPAADVSLVVMGQRNVVAVDYTTDASALVGAINAWAPVSNSQQVNNVPEGVYDAARALERDRPHRPVMVVLARQLLQESHLDPQRVLDQISRSGALVEVVSVDVGRTDVPVGSLLDMTARDRILGDGSRQSGGRRLEVTALTAVPRALQDIADGLLSQLAVTYAVPANAKPSDRLSIRLERRGLTLRAPTRWGPFDGAARD